MNNGPTDEILLRRRSELETLFNSHAPIGRALGMSLCYDGEGRACFDQPYNPDFDHALNGIHGGVIATLLDNAGWFTAAPFYENWIATVEMQMRLHEPVRHEHLTSIGSLVAWSAQASG